MSEQLAEGENAVQFASIWGQNEVLEGLGRCLWDQEPGLMWPKGSQGRLPQFRQSILGSFWATFRKTLETKTASKNKVCFRCILGNEIKLKIDRFWDHIRTGWRRHFTIRSEMRKVDFWTIVHAFWRILVFSKIHWSWVLEAKINFNANLETDLNLGPISERFGYHKLLEIGIQIHSKTRLDTTSFLEPFLGTLGGAKVEEGTPKMTFQGGRMREPKEGVTMSHTHANINTEV